MLWGTPRGPGQGLKQEVGGVMGGVHYHGHVRTGWLGFGRS